MRNRKNVRVFLNSHCRYNTGLNRWKKVREELRALIGDFEENEIRAGDQFGAQVSTVMEEGAETLIAAGGDGTVNLLLNEIMSSPVDRGRITIGAVGLGSSNDFHKPLRSEACVKGIPVRIDAAKAIHCDVIRIDYQDPKGDWNVRFCLNNASIGITAEANAFYNSRPKFIKGLRKMSIETAIVASALKTILTYQCIPSLLKVGQRKPEHVTVTNLGIIKNPHFAGSFCYDSDIKPDDGRLGINLCEHFSFPETIKMLFALSRHHFQGLRKTRSWIDTQGAVRGDQIFALEMDGEVVRATNAIFRIIPKAVRCCR